VRSVRAVRRAARPQTQLNVEFPGVTRSLPVLRVVVVSDTGALLS